MASPRAATCDRRRRRSRRWRARSWAAWASRASRRRSKRRGCTAGRRGCRSCPWSPRSGPGCGSCCARRERWPRRDGRRRRAAGHQPLLTVAALMAAATGGPLPLAVAGDTVGVAKALLDVLTVAPRPAGSAAEARARSVCTGHLEALGFDVREEPFGYSALPGLYATP